jgi:hypothetical protein
MIVPKFFSDRLMTTHKFRKFQPAMTLMIKEGLIKLHDIDKLLEGGSATPVINSVSKFTKLNIAPPAINVSLLKSATRMAIRDLFPKGIPKLEPLQDVDVLMQRTNWTANCGFPYFKKKALIKEKFHELYSTFADGFDLSKLKDLARHPCVMFLRTQVRKIDATSTRGVYCEPGLYVGCETRFSQPITSWACNNFGSTAYVIGMKQRELGQRLIGLRTAHKYCLDYSSFDLTAHPKLIASAFYIVKLLYEDQPRECHNYIDFLCERFCFGENYHPLIGRVPRKRGVPSGSAFTNIIDTFVNIILIRYSFLKMGKNWAIKEILAHGDDSIVVSMVRVSVEKIAHASLTVGMIVNSEKSAYYAKGDLSVEFLGSKWVNGLPERDLSVMATKASLVQGKPVILPCVFDYVKSRIFTMFGFDHRLPQLWERFGFGKLEGQRVYMLNDALAWDQSLLNRSQGITGSWVTASKDPWMDR